MASLWPLTGCKSRKVPPAEPAQVVLTLWHTFNKEETETLNVLLGQLRQRHPRWQVQSTVIPFGRAQNEYRRAAASCRPGAPDVFRAEMPWLSDLISRQLIRPVPSRGRRARADLLPAAVEAATYRGQRWMLPASVDCLALLYNRALVPRPPTSQAALLTAARALTLDARGRDAADPAHDPTTVTRWGFYVRADAYWFLPFLWARGGRLLDADKGQVFVDQPTAVAALTYYRDLIRVHHVAPPRPSPSDDYEDMMRRFGRGQVAMIVNGPWATRTLLSRPAFKDPAKLGVAPFPPGADGNPAAPRSAHGYVVSRCARDPKAAWALARALSDLQAQTLFAQRNSLMPSLRAAYQQQPVKGNALVTGFRDALAGSRARPRHPAMARVFDDFTPAVRAALLGDATAGEALAGVGRAWRRLLAPAKGK